MLYVICAPVLTKGTKSTFSRSLSLLQLLFFCQQEPGKDCGGETPLVKGSDILSRLDPQVLKTFAKKEVRYVRYAPPRGPGAYLPWQDVFLTDDPKVCIFSFLMFAR